MVDEASYNRLWDSSAVVMWCILVATVAMSRERDGTEDRSLARFDNNGNGKLWCKWLRDMV